MKGPATFESPMMEERSSLMRRLQALHRADLILHSIDDLDTVLQRFLELIMEVAQVESGTLYMVDEETDELVFTVVRGPPGVDRAYRGRRMPMGQGIVGHAAQRGEPIWIPEIEHSRHWARDLSKLSGYRPRNVLCLPLKVQERVIGVVQLFDHPDEHPYTQADIDFLSMLTNDLALKVENARLLGFSQEMVARLRALLDVGVELGTTLDRDHVLHLILHRVGELLQVEAATIFELDEKTGELVLCAGTQIPAEDLGKIRVPPGEGIAGWVAQNMQTIQVQDVRADPRFCRKVEEQTDLATHSILCTPLVVQEQVPGQEGVFRQRVVGVIQALNKKDEGPFSPTDVEIFEGLARQAVIAMERARLFQQVNDMFVIATTALIDAIGAKSPYLRGHSERVAATSGALANELGLPQADVERIRMAALLHDIGNIGIPDAILNKAGRLSDEEMEIISRHPLDGERVLRPFWHLREAIPGVAQHHEKYDGTGYPRGLRGEEISLDGRIITVANAFDAMTSDRPYRRALPAETALEELRAQAGRQFDPKVVEAFLRMISRQGL